MALVSKRFEDRERDWGLRSRQRDSWFDRDDGWLRDWKDWPTDWPQPRDLVERFERNTDRWWKDWPADWPKMDVVMPRFSSHLDQMHSDWRTDPFWRDIYPRWAEPIFKEGIDVNAKIRNDDRGFGVDVDAYQFKPEELQVKTQGDTLLIEGKHEDVRDSDNFTKMHFIRRYQLPRDVDPREVTSSIDTSGRLTVEAPRRLNAIRGNERLIPVEGPSRIRSTSASPRTRHDSGYGRSDFSPRSNDRNTPLTVDPDSREHRYSGRESRERDYRDYTRELANRDYGTRDLNSRDYNSRNYDSRDYNTTQQQSYYRRAESRTSASPHDVTVANENRQYNNGRNTPFEERPVDRRDERREERRDELFGTGPHRQANKSFFNSIRDKFERGFGRRERTERTERDYRQETPVAPREPREHDYRGSERRGYSTDRNGYNSDRDRVTDSRLGYRVDSPSSYAGSQRNGGLLTTAEPRSESRAESVHQVQILRREKRY